MIYKKHGVEGCSLTVRTYHFLEPVKLKIRNPNGEEKVFGFGIGERVSVLEPSTTYLVPSYEKLDEIPLADGSFITGYEPHNMKYGVVHRALV